MSELTSNSPKNIFGVGAPLKRPVVSKEDVIMAFKMFLGREPEDTSVIDNYYSKNWSFDELRRTFLTSEEFKTKVPALYGYSLHKPLEWPKSDVEVDVSDDQLSQMVSHIEDSWERLGEAAPHWSVLTVDRFKPDQISETEGRFYETGGESVMFMQSAANRYNIDISQYKTCFELGCGVGRVTVWLADHFTSVIAADISRPHLKLAQEAADSRKLHNIDFRHINRLDEFSNLGGFDCFFSVIVLQHNPPPVTRLLLKKILSSLNAGGMAYFQVVTYIKGYKFLANEYLSKITSEGKMEVHALPQDVIFELARLTGCRVVEVREDGWSGSPVMISNSFLILKD